jgi:hypothetical protein
MNRYSVKFKAKCPNNGAIIDYSLRIETDEMIMVEELLQFIKKHSSEGFHEQIADDLVQSFGGSQYLVATHENVKIETYRK